MMKKEVRLLVEKFNSGNISKDEELLLEQYIENGEVTPEEIETLKKPYQLFTELNTPEPSFDLKLDIKESSNRSLGERLYQKLDHLWVSNVAFKFAYTLAILLVGASIGYLIPLRSDTPEIKTLANEVHEMKEMMMLTLLEKESTSERLRAVNLTSQLPQVSDKVATALLKTLNNDENVNVRLAAIEALAPYSDNPIVRKGLVESIGQQDSPLVQVALAELMVSLMERSSVKELEQVINKENTPPEIKERLKETIEILI